MSRYVSLDLLQDPDVIPREAEVAAEPDVEAVKPECPVASLSDRCIAAALDTIFLLAIFAVIDTWILLTWSLPGKAELNVTTAALLISATLDAAIFFAYFWFLEASLGFTLGKAMLGIRVQWKPDRTSHRSALGASATRNLLRLVDGLGFYLVGLVIASCSGLHQRLGDIFAGTVVVAPTLKPWTKALAIVLWVAALAGSVCAVPRICKGSYDVHRLPYLGRIVIHLGRTDNSVYARTARFRIEVQQNDSQVTPHAVTRNASAPASLAASN